MKKIMKRTAVFALALVIALSGLSFAGCSSKEMVIIYTSEDGKNRPVLLENETKVDWKVGEYYRIFGDAYNTYDGMPWLIARYTYK